MSSVRTDWLVFDDFFSDPEAIRQEAIHADFSVSPGSPVRRQILEPRAAVAEQIRRLMKLEDLHDFQCRFHFYPEEDKGHTTVVHSDSERGQWAGLVYLNRERQGQSGTGFFRHKETQLDRIPALVDLAFHGLERGMAPAEMVSATQRDATRLEAWDREGQAEIQFNRLVLFPSCRFHALESVWGQTPADSRLTFNFFFSH